MEYKIHGNLTMSTENLTIDENILIRFRLAFERVGLSKAEVAKIIEYSKTQITDALNGKTPLSSKLCKIFCFEFGISYKWIMTGEGDISPHENIVREPQTEYLLTDRQRRMIELMEEHPEIENDIYISALETVGFSRKSGESRQNKESVKQSDVKNVAHSC